MEPIVPWKNHPSKPEIPKKFHEVLYQLQQECLYTSVQFLSIAQIYF